MDRAARPAVIPSGGDTPNPRLVAERVTLPIRFHRHHLRLTEVLCVLVLLTPNQFIVSSTPSDASSDLLTNIPLTLRFVTLHSIFTLQRTMPAIRFITAELHCHCSWRSDTHTHCIDAS